MIISLTSHLARFATLEFTLKDLLCQTVTPNRLILWLSPDDLRQLPQVVWELRDFGLEVRRAEDGLGPYTKIIPALEAFPEAFIVTADDDVHYEPGWLAGLTGGFDPKAPTVVCYRAHRIRFDAHGEPALYANWEHNLRYRETGRDLLPTGVRGVLYPPHSLGAEAMDTTLFKALAPTADDLWLYWMGRRRGLQVTALGQTGPVITWKGSQAAGLFQANTGPDALNDISVRRLVRAFGSPAPTE